MGFLDWKTILEAKSNEELIDIYENKGEHPEDKVNIAIELLIKRGLLSREGVLKEHEHPHNQNAAHTNIPSTRPNLKRAKIAKTFIVIILLMELVSITSTFFQYDIIMDYEQGNYVSDNYMNNVYLIDSFIGYLYFALTIVSGITFILWFRRAYYNLHQRVADCNYTDGWAAGAWFVPILGLFRPYQIMHELWKKTNRLIEERGIGNLKRLNLPILGFWWFLWIVVNIFSNVLFRMSLNAITLQEIKDVTVFYFINSMLGIPLAIITIQIIDKFKLKEEFLYSQEKDLVEVKD